MPQIKVSALTALTATDGAEELLINDGGISKKVTIDNVLHDNSIRSEHYVDGSIDSDHLAGSKNDNIGDSTRAVAMFNIADLAVTNRTLASQAVTTGKIAPTRPSEVDLPSSFQTSICMENVP